MDCAEDLVCQLFDWFSSSGYVIRETFHALDSLWNSAGGFLSHHGEKIVAAASFSFGAWRWWVYREQVLHKRLEEYIRDSDERLGSTTTRMLDAILRPGRAVALPQPAFAIEVSQVLQGAGWRRMLGLGPVEWQTQQQLWRALIGVRKRQRIVSDAARSLQRQRAEIHTLRGALSASKARRLADQRHAGKYDGRALREFQSALQTETHRRDAEAKECEAFQFLRLGQRSHAEQSYEDVEEFAHDIGDARRRDLIIARARRYRAQIWQVEAPGGSVGALGLIGAGRNPDPKSALALRARYQPYQSWDAVEQAEMHYVAAYIANRYQAKNIEPQQLALSEANYREVLEKLPKRLVFVRQSTRALRAEAQAGLDRITLAKTGKYNTRWLMGG